jgi:anti-anti-sigma regulatory factor
MFQVKADATRKLLIMTFSGHVLLEDLNREEERLRALAKDLQPGFQLLSDLTGLEAMDPACLTQIRKTMDLLNQTGVSRVVRVIPNPRKDIGFNILSLFHYRRGIPIVTCADLNEAMSALQG